MLPFTNRTEQRARHNNFKGGQNANGSLKDPMPPPPRPASSSSKSRGSFSPGLDVPRKVGQESLSQVRKDTFKQDLKSCASFAELNRETLSTTRDEQADVQHISPRNAVAAPEASYPGVASGAVDDPIWLECKTDIDKFEGLIHGTFTTSENANFDFGEDMRKAEQAFHDAKATIRKASKRLSYHWHREQQYDKLSRMLAEQISLGQRIRKAWAQAMAIKERILDVMLEGQLEIGSEEMEEFLSGLDPCWFEEEQEKIDRV